MSVKFIVPNDYLFGANSLALPGGVIFDSGSDHVINVGTNTHPTAAGHSLTIQAGSGSGAGGPLVLKSGDGGSGQAAGNTYVDTGTGSTGPGTYTVAIGTTYAKSITIGSTLNNPGVTIISNGIVLDGVNSGFISIGNTIGPVVNLYVGNLSSSLELWGGTTVRNRNGMFDVRAEYDAKNSLSIGKGSTFGGIQSGFIQNGYSGLVIEKDNGTIILNAQDVQFGGDNPFFTAGDFVTVNARNTILLNDVLSGSYVRLRSGSVTIDGNSLSLMPTGNPVTASGHWNFTNTPTVNNVLVLLSGVFDPAVVHITGSETITGPKNFTSPITASKSPGGTFFTSAGADQTLCFGAGGAGVSCRQSGSGFFAIHTNTDNFENNPSNERLRIDNSGDVIVYNNMRVEKDFRVGLTASDFFPALDQFLVKVATDKAVGIRAAFGTGILQFGSANDAHNAYVPMAIDANPLLLNFHSNSPVTASGSWTFASIPTVNGIPLSAGSALSASTDVFDSQLTTTAPTTLATHTPATPGNYLISFYFRAVGTTSMSASLTWSDGSGPQFQVLVVSSSYTTNSYPVFPVYISAQTASISVVANAGTANNIYVSTSIVRI